MHTRTRTHACTHARTHIHTHTHTRTRTHRHAHTDMQPHTHSHARTGTAPTDSHACNHARTLTQRRHRSHRYTHSFEKTYFCTIWRNLGLQFLYARGLIQCWTYQNQKSASLCTGMGTVKNVVHARFGRNFRHFGVHAPACVCVCVCCKSLFKIWKCVFSKTFRSAKAFFRAFGLKKSNGSGVHIISRRKMEIQSTISSFCRRKTHSRSAGKMMNSVSKHSNFVTKTQIDRTAHFWHFLVDSCTLSRQIRWSFVPAALSNRLCTCFGVVCRTNIDKKGDFSCLCLRTKFRHAPYFKGA